MAQALLALGTGVATVSGGVWYLPALADLRAGADRPASRRTAATACVSGWGTAAVVAVLLLMTETWWISGAVAGAGATVTAGLRIGSTVQRRREVRETARQWVELHGGPGPVDGIGRRRNVVAVLISVGLCAAVLIAIFKVVAGPGNTRNWLVTTAISALVVSAFLALALTHVPVVRRGDRNRLRR